MKHDPELIRHILDHVARREGDTDSSQIPTPAAHSPAAVHEHVALLIEHNLLEGQAGGADKPHAVRAVTSEGHALLRALRDKGVQEKIKHAGTHLGEDVTLHVILDIAKAFLVGL